MDVENNMQQFVYPSMRRHQVNQSRPKSFKSVSRLGKEGHDRVYEVDDYREHSFGDKK
jgi:hypothetical protein